MQSSDPTATPSGFTPPAGVATTLQPLVPADKFKLGDKVQLIPDVRGSSLVSSFAAGGSSGAIVDGSRVVLAPDYKSYGDAKDGPLSPGDIGVVDADGSTSRMRIKVDVGAKKGQTWYFDRAALRLAEPPKTQANEEISNGCLGTKEWIHRDILASCNICVN